MQKVENPSLTRAITDFVSNAVGEEVEQVVFYGGSILNLILWEKNIRWQDTKLIISNFRSANAVFDRYPENLTTTDNTRKGRFTCYFKEKRMHF